MNCYSTLQCEEELQYEDTGVVLEFVQLTLSTTDMVSFNPLACVSWKNTTEQVDSLFFVMLG